MAHEVQGGVRQEVDGLRHCVRHARQETLGAGESVGVDVVRRGGEVVQVANVAVEVPVEE